MRAKTIQDYILKHVPQHPFNIVQHTSAHFEITVQGVHKHLRELLASGQIIRHGKTRGAHYALPNMSEKTPESKNKAIREIKLDVNSNLDESEVWTRQFETYVTQFPTNVQRICEYSFTEILNNVKDHSEARHCIVSLTIENEFIRITIYDDGIGIFKKIREAFDLEDYRVAILHLSKGKVTTDSSRHSGEGIFFTSRACNEFSISSGGVFFIRFSEEDWLLRSEDHAGIGTLVTMKVATDAKLNLVDLFKRYQSTDHLSFDKTHVAVELGKIEGETHISRSQAKRVLAGLEKFQHILLDFRRVDTVGQGFVDEVFRVFQNQHLNISIKYINANEDVEFMIKRTLPQIK